ncbi:MULTISPECIES: SprT family protein [Loigolactobacillus]|uniref:Protein SprT-like n=1 Tax=Loigolactobacillus backii TaxID=375175 RepID=A0A192GZ39_9LACO|nr:MULTISPECIES: SprT family protein [Loigolactobacillus]ANK61298.1 SprT family protein [Loigolactobacillus backii]ANK69502.1 SprT family protein [Loigolactobacillus backii]MDA5388155.1 SprT family protein [Loigolactobacillus backii]MDA5390627.1 SprT family protein [Loigolactobacillus backii]
MDNTDLTKLVQEVSLTSFRRPFKHVAVFNSRLRTTGGRYDLRDHHIDINPKMYQHYGKQVLIGIIKHELCHYHLHLTGSGYQHRDAAFKKLLLQVGGSRYAPALPQQVGKNKYQYVCRKCGHRYQRQRRINLKKYVCGHCHGHLQLITERGESYA